MARARGQTCIEIPHERGHCVSDEADEHRKHYHSGEDLARVNDALEWRLHVIVGLCRARAKGRLKRLLSRLMAHACATIHSASVS